MLILFDIDGTLYHGDRSGWGAFLDAGRELFGPAFNNDNVQFNGWIDPLIFAALMRHNGLPTDEKTHESFRRAGHRHLRLRFASGEHDLCALPGALDLVQALRKLPDQVTLGLLTGNYPSNGRLKLESVGYQLDWFDIQVWGTDGPRRDALPQVARQRYEQSTGCEIGWDRIVIVGDTPHDVSCARANGCRSLAVATGGVPAEQLRQAGADLVVESLAETDALVDWLLCRAPRAGGDPSSRGCR